MFLQLLKSVMSNSTFLSLIRSFSNLCRLRSQLTMLYRLPKLHKLPPESLNITPHFRTIYSSIGNYNYNLLTSRRNQINQIALLYKHMFLIGSVNNLAYLGKQ